MSGWAYYNEIEPYAAQWLRNLIAAGHIAPGVVDERSILDVHPTELRGFTQCHFFAGAGVWSLALRLAGWPDDRCVWTGSCPCQPFSAAGKGAGFDDERHLWPAWHHIISECRPAAVFGEQVASSDAGPWIDLVQDDMEALGYAFGAIPFPSAGVGAPHIRDRLYWVAHAELHDRAGRPGEAHGTGALESDRRRAAGFVGDTSSAGLAQCVGERGVLGGTRGTDARQAIERAGVRPRRRSEQQERADRIAGYLAGGVADDDDAGCVAEPGVRVRWPDLHDPHGRGPVNGAWADAEWIACRDGKWRPVEPGTLPLAHGAPSRVGRLRAYGNAINAQAAAAFVRAAS